MAKKDTAVRKSGGTTEVAENDLSATVQTAKVESAAAAIGPAAPAAKPKEKSKEDASAGGSVAVGEIRKAAAFANSVGGLDKALALLQILKVAKEVQ